MVNRPPSMWTHTAAAAVTACCFTKWGDNERHQRLQGFSKTGFHTLPASPVVYLRQVRLLMIPSLFTELISSTASVSLSLGWLCGWWQVRTTHWDVRGVLTDHQEASDVPTCWWDVVMDINIEIIWFKCHYSFKRCSQPVAGAICHHSACTGCESIFFFVGFVIVVPAHV